MHMHYRCVFLRLYVCGRPHAQLEHQVQLKSTQNISNLLLKNCSGECGVLKFPFELHRNAAVVAKLPYAKAGGGDKWVKHCSS